MDEANKEGQAGHLTIREEKAAARRWVRAQEKKIGPDLRQACSQQITDKLESLPAYQAADTVFAFVGMQNEIDTRRFLEDSLAAGKRLGVPRTYAMGQMDIREIRSLDQLQEGHYGILEPTEAAPLIRPEEVDFAVIPCASCNPQGQRLGKGGGFYDRFLEGYQGEAAMVCFSLTMRENIPVDVWDQRVALVVSDQGIYRDGVKQEEKE